MKKLIALLMALVMCLSSCACGAKEEVIELTVSNVKDYLAFSKDVSDGNIEKSTSTALGIGFTKYKGNGKYILNASRKDNVGFKDVSLTIKLTIGNGFEDSIWNFSSGGIAKSPKEDVHCFSKTVHMNISYDGTGSVTEDMVCDATEMTLAIQPRLSAYTEYEIISVRGSVVVTK